MADPETASPRRAWLQVLGDDVKDLSRSVKGALADVGVTVSDAAAPEPSSPGVLVFGQVGSAVLDRLRVLSQNGLGRVVAVAPPSPALADQSWQILQNGAADVIAWEHPGDASAQVAARLERWGAIDAVVESPLVAANLVGTSPAWIASLRQVIEVGRFTQAPVLITGESGTGKELAARLVHTLDQRTDKGDLVVLDCTTIVPELSGSEFFGHERGAYTDAQASREGLFALADGGTLFLDEVGELPLKLQAQVLRVIEEGTYRPVGGNRWFHTDFRLVCATNRDLADAVACGDFRRDLYYRMADCTCRLPPLRDRQDDILPLARHFVSQQSGETEPPELDAAVCNYLLRRAYKGNVRDLKQCITRIMSRYVGPGKITVGDVPEDERPGAVPEGADWRMASFKSAVMRALSVGASWREIGHAAQDAALEAALAEEGGSVARAAKRLGVNRRTIETRRAARRKLEGAKLRPGPSA